MISTGPLRRVWMTVLLLACACAAASAQSASSDVTLLRVFLNDGTTLVSYGEFSRVGDRIVVSLPIQLHPPSLQLVSIPASRVNWEKTDAYAESARAARYAATRGPDDYALLGQSVTRALTDITLAAEPQRKVAMALEARQNLTKWIAEHYGYRAADVARMAGWFDDVISQTRRSAGQQNYDLSLVAANAAPPSVPLLPPPPTDATLQQAFAAAAMVESAAERTSLLQAIHDALQGNSDPSLAPLRSQVNSTLATEERTTSIYAAFTRMLRAAALYAARADVAALVRLSTRILQEDDKLGHDRPEELASLLTTVDAKLEEARRLRLARDQWAERQAVLQAYEQAIAEPAAALRLSRTALIEIQQLAGPSLGPLDRAHARLTVGARALALVKPPQEVEAAHALLVGAMQLATRAVEGRRVAIRTGVMQTAKDASSAAAGALLLLTRATDELEQMTRPPQPK